MRSWSKASGLAAPKAKHGVRYELECRFISPVFGGGPEPKKYDPISPVRVPSLRGQLRFWWRATRGDFSLAELFKAETLLFGGVHGKEPVASAVSIHVAEQPGHPRQLSVFEQGNPFRTEKGLSRLAYGAFPLRGLDAKNTHDYLWLYDKSFKLHFHCTFSDEHRDVAAELERALWAWLHFGGLGGRTRRGFGAVELVRGTRWEPNSDSSRPWAPKDLNGGWEVYVETASSTDWPVLEKSPTVGRSFGNGREAQEHLLELLHRMRQGPLGRKPNNPKPGRSYWPEPDAIRSRYQTRGRHETPIHDPRIDAFPRAHFGAPIIFHFKKEPGEKEPPDTSLQPVVEGEKKERLASPLILRPHPDGQGRYDALALRLAHPAPDGWCLVEGRQQKRVTSPLTAEQARRVAPLNGERDAVAAYLKLLASQAQQR